MTMKFVEGVPLYRQEQHYARMGNSCNGLTLRDDACKLWLLLIVPERCLKFDFRNCITEGRNKDKVSSAGKVQGSFTVLWV